MAENIQILVQPPDQVIIDTTITNHSVTASANIVTVGAGTSATFLNYAGGEGLPASTVEVALDTLAERSFVSATAPTVGVSEGDTWYDSDDDIMYVRRENEWKRIITEVGPVDGGEYS